MDDISVLSKFHIKPKIYIREKYTLVDKKFEPLILSSVIAE